MVHEELAAYAEDDGFTNVFRHQLPTSPNLCIVFRTTPGMPTLKSFGSTDPYREKPRVQVVVRGNPQDANEPMTRANLLVHYLGAIENQEIGDVYYESVQVVNGPFPLQTDDNKCTEVVFNLQISKAPSPS